uniref:VanZ-like domain-containing protein n=1 Tax=Chlorobium phaeovibrioides (strain DSM 265 / 1930) TaxID=290318 RepID=A4SF23_CHLPM
MPHSSFRLRFLSLALFIAGVSAIAFWPKHDAADGFFPQFDKYQHVLTFLVLSVFMFAFWFESRGISFFILLSYGFFIELVQFFLPGHECSLNDLIADMAGVTVGYFLVLKSSLFSGFR